MEQIRSNSKRSQIFGPNVHGAFARKFAQTSITNIYPRKPINLPKKNVS